MKSRKNSMSEAAAAEPRCSLLPSNQIELHPRAPSEILLKADQVSERIGVSKSTLYRYVAQGHFPRPIELRAGGAVRWPASLVNAWIAQRFNRAPYPASPGAA